MMQNKQCGLTLVELMVVVAVMAIISTIAYPIYTNQVQKSRRADAKIALETIALAQERHYTINGAYTNDLSLLQVPVAIQGGVSAEGYYTVSVTHPGGDSQQFVATASIVATGAQSGDSACSSFTVNQLGVKAPVTGCW